MTLTDAAVAAPVPSRLHRCNVGHLPVPPDRCPPPKTTIVDFFCYRILPPNPNTIRQHSRSQTAPSTPLSAQTHALVMETCIRCCRTATLEQSSNTRPSALDSFYRKLKAYFMRSSTSASSDGCFWVLCMNYLIYFTYLLTYYSVLVNQPITPN